MPNQQQQALLRAFSIEQIIAQPHNQPLQLQQLLQIDGTWTHLCLVRFQLVPLSRQIPEQIFRGEYHFRQAKLAQLSTQAQQHHMQAALTLHNIHALIDKLSNHCNKQELAAALACAHHMSQHYPAVSHFYLAQIYYQCAKQGYFTRLKSQYLDKAAIAINCYHFILQANNLPEYIAVDAVYAMANAGLTFDSSLCQNFCDKLDTIRCQHNLPLTSATTHELIENAKQELTHYVSDYYQRDNSALVR